MTNGAAIGYAILAGRAIGLTRRQLEALERAMLEGMDFSTEEEAETVYRTA